jgi:hypothetical protein
MDPSGGRRRNLITLAVIFFMVFIGLVFGTSYLAQELIPPYHWANLPVFLTGVLLSLVALSGCFFCVLIA